MCWLFCIMNAQISQHNLFVSDSYKINQSINQSSKLSCSDQFEVALTWPDLYIDETTIRNIRCASNGLSWDHVQVSELTGISD